MKLLSVALPAREKSGARADKPKGQDPEPRLGALIDTDRRGNATVPGASLWTI